MAVKEKIRIRLKSYDHQLIDSSAEKIVEFSVAFIEHFKTCDPRHP